MPLLFNRILRELFFLSSCLGVALIPVSQLSAADSVPEQSAESGETSPKTSRGFTARDKNRSGTPHEWSRTLGRPDLVPATAAGNSTTEPKIRFVSASGAEESEVTSATVSDEDAATLPVTQESDSSAATPSLSVKEQLLNALRAQREATIDAAALPTKPGTLTILNSPSRKTEPAVEMTQPSIAVSTESSAATDAGEHQQNNSGSTGQIEPTPAVSDAAKSRIGLTRTLEADLHSSDPFVRDRAQRYLRLEMQLLKLRASKAEADELAAPTANHQPAEAAVQQLPKHDAEEVLPSEPGEIVLHEDSHSDPHEVPHADPHTESHSAADAAVLEKVVVDGPIDRLGLANNLFAVGKYPLALEIYQQASAEILPAHQTYWVEYQTANCIRRLGKPAEASQRYRKLANQPEAGWLSEQAQWWIDTLEKIRVLESTLADNSIEHHRASIEQVEKVTTSVDELTSPPAASSQPPQKDPHHDAHAH
jgi:tetratricopeptide (TPR) repeat protein